MLQMGRQGASLSSPRESLPLKAKKLLYKRLHILQWLPEYTRNDILADFISGLTVGLTMMPQSIAYAGLAGLAPQYGLYTAFIGSFTYVFLGTVKEVSIGPTSLMSLLTFSYTVGKPSEFVILLTFIAGIVELLMGILNLGFLVEFISPCLTSGFTSATTLIIAIAQLKHVFGIKIKSHDCIGVLREFFQKINEFKWADTIMSLSCFIFLICFKQLPKLKVKNPTLRKIIWLLSISKNALIVLIASLVAVYLQHNGGVPFRITGEVPKGLPDFGFPSMSAKFQNETVGYKEMFASLGSGVIVVPVVAVLANVAIAKAYSGMKVVDTSQEMISLGICNILGSFVKAMPSCGAFTRSAVASSSDVRTPVQGVYSGSVIILALSFLAPYFCYIPQSTLAAVLITAASSLLDYEIYPVLWRCNKVDFFLTLSTFIFGTLFGVEIALTIGCAFNILVLLRTWSRPRIFVETRRKDDKDQHQYLYIKPELGLYYAGSDYVSESIKKYSQEYENLPIVLDCANIIRLDYAAARTLENLLKTYNDNNTKLVMINVAPDILETMRAVTDTDYAELWHNSDSIPDLTIHINNLEENPLLDGAIIDVRKLSFANSLGRRKSSIWSEERRSSTHREERKQSIYDFE